MLKPWVQKLRLCWLAGWANNPVTSTSIANDDESSNTDIVRAADTLQYGESTYSVLKFPSFRNIDLDTLDKKYGATKFVYALESFLCCHHMYCPDFWNTQPVKYEIFKWCQIYIPPTPEVLKLVIIDPIRASPMVPACSRNKEVPSKFDTVLVWKELSEVGTHLDLLGSKGASASFLNLFYPDIKSAGLHVGQVCVIFNLPEQLGTFPHPLAYIEWFTPLHSLDDRVRMFKVQHSTHGSQQLNASIIPVTYLSWSCQLTSYFGCSMDHTWTSDNVLNVC